MSKKLFLLERDKIGNHRLDLSFLNLNTELNTNGFTMDEMAENLPFHKKVSLAKVNGEIVGWSVVCDVPKLLETNKIMSQIATYVLPEFRKKGIGKQLILQELKANKYKCDGVYFFCGTKNKGKIYKETIKELKMTKHRRSIKLKGWFYSFFSPEKEIKAICKVRNKLNNKGIMENVYF